MNRCYLPGPLGDMLNALCSAVGYNLRWLMRTVVRLNLPVAFLRLVRATAQVACAPCLSVLAALRALVLRHVRALSCSTVVPMLESLAQRILQGRLLTPEGEPS
jgi:hypothetical protein